MLLASKLIDNIQLRGTDTETVFDQTVETIFGLETSLDKYKGKVLLIVNIASKCTYTPQLLELERLYKKYRDQGLVVLGFPSNQFLNQAPGTNRQLADFCLTNYGVSFPLFAKLRVKGRRISPLYDFLIKNSPVRRGRKVKWNFEKFLVNKNGVVINRYKSATEPQSIEEDIKVLL